VFSRLAPVIAALGAAAFLQGCATEPVTKLEMSWMSPQFPRQPFNKLLIISVAREDFVQIAFQDQMAAALKERGINAVASKRYFSSGTDESKARFKQTIEQSGADYVLVGYVTGRDKKTRDDQFMTIGDATGLYTSYDRYVSVARASNDYSLETVTAEVAIFGVEGKKLIWSARTRTDNPRSTSGENFAPGYVAIILEAMKKDKVF
jgi:hypothetical protein